MLRILYGKSGAGKDTIAKELCRNHAHERIITTTTRPMRPGEKNGVDYNFVSDKEFKKMRKEGRFIESKDYNPAQGGVWSYGSEVTDEQINSPKDYVIILTPAGITDAFRALKERGSDMDNVTAIYIKADRSVLEKRLASRGDDPKEIARRLDADDRDFEGAETLADYVYTNTDEPGIEYAGNIIADEECRNDFMRMQKRMGIEERERTEVSDTNGPVFEVTDPTEDDIYWMGNEMMKEAIKERDHDTTDNHCDIADLTDRL